MPNLIVITQAKSATHAATVTLVMQVATTCKH